MQTCEQCGQPEESLFRCADRNCPAYLCADCNAYNDTARYSDVPGGVDYICCMRCGGSVERKVGYYWVLVHNDNDEDKADPAKQVDRDFISPIGYWTDFDSMYCALVPPEDDPSFNPKDRDKYGLLCAPTPKTMRIPFICVGCYKEEPHRVIPGESPSEVRAMEHRVVAEWDGGQNTGLPARLQCEPCFARHQRHQEKLRREREEDHRREEIERREWDKRSQAKQSIKRKAKQEEQERRLRTTAGADDADKARMATLKIDALKRVCAANMLLVSGNKSQLLERLIGCRRHGRLGSACPQCKCGKLEMCYRDDGPSGSFPEPSAVHCKHMKGMGRPCGYVVKITSGGKSEVLKGKLIDSPEGDLAGAQLILV